MGHEGCPLWSVVITKANVADWDPRGIALLTFGLISAGLAKAQYAVGYFTEMGIGCRRDPLEANVWHVRAADQGDERAKHRIAAIRAAASGADPNSIAASRNLGKLKGRPYGSSG